MDRSAPFRVSCWYRMDCGIQSRLASEIAASSSVPKTIKTRKNQLFSSVRAIVSGDYNGRACIGMNKIENSPFASGHTVEMSVPDKCTHTVHCIIDYVPSEFFCFCHFRIFLLHAAHTHTPRPRRPLRRQQHRLEAGPGMVNDKERN